MSEIRTPHLDKRRSAEENSSLPPDDDALVGHGRDVGTSGGARTHDDGDLFRQSTIVLETDYKFNSKTIT